MNGARLRAWLHPRYPLPGAASRRDGSTSADRNAPAFEGEWVRSMTQAYLESFRAELLGSYHWTMFSAQVSVDCSRHSVHVTGHAPLGSIAPRLARGLRSLLIPRWSIVLTLTAADERAPWRSLAEPLTRVWREWPGAVSIPSLSTELARSDGPVMALAETDAGTLIRAVDGTIGWITDRLADRFHSTSSRRRKPDLDRWGAVARSYVGAVYRSGGTTPEGFDCSGLTQRIYREAAGTIIPRHSSDQFAAHDARREPPHEGQLAFIGRPDGSVHVGVVIRNPHSEWSVVHASSPRSVVVEDPLDWYRSRVE